MTLQDVLHKAAARPDGVVEWMYPEAPVIFKCDPHSGPTFGEPDITQQMCHSLTAMAEDTSLIGNFWTHNIRRGAARDSVYRVDRSKLTTGTAKTVTAQIFGHDLHALNDGTTQSYVGAYQGRHWNARVEYRSLFIDELVPSFKDKVPDLIVSDELVDG